MNTREYIESGVIERFVMGETNERETRELIEQAAKYPEIQAEIQAVENVLIGLAEHYSHKPSERTKEALFSKLFPEVPEHSPGTGRQVSFVAEHKIQGNGGAWKKYLVAASVALLASLALNIFFYNKWQLSENALVAISREKQEFAGIMASEKQRYKTLEQQMQMVNSMHIMRVKLSGSKMMPEAKAIVYYDSSSRDVYLHVAQLPATAQDKQYQLWAIINGNPVDAGVFDANEESKAMVKMKRSEKPAAFAVTREKRGGSAVPTLDEMVLIGHL